MNEFIIRSDGKMELKKDGERLFLGTPEELSRLERGDAIKECRFLLHDLIEKIDEVDKHDKQKIES